MTDRVAGVPQPADHEALLDQLNDAFRPRLLTPPPASVAALHRAVEQRWRPTARGRMKEQLVALARRLQRTGVVVAVFGGVAVGGTAVAVAGAGSIHPPVPHLLHDRGHSVHSPVAHSNGSSPSQRSADLGAQTPSPPVPTTPPPRAGDSVATGAAAQTLVDRARATERGAAGTSAPGPRSAADTGHSDHPLSGPGSMAPTYGTNGYQAPPDLATWPAWTASGTWTATGTWPADPGWPQPSDSASAAIGNAPPTSSPDQRDTADGHPCGTPPGADSTSRPWLG